MGPWDRRILWEYWYRLCMVACMRGYARAEFKGFQGVNQVDPLSPTIFNVVVDAVVRHWILLVTDVALSQDGWVS